jgi:ureidoacrylate peracid hydrolase
VTNYRSGTRRKQNMSLRTRDVDVLTGRRPPTPPPEHTMVIAREEDEPVIGKHYHSGFHETHPGAAIRGYNAKNLVVGVDSRICLGTTVTEATYRKYWVIAVRDAVHTMDYPETTAAVSAKLLPIGFIEKSVGYTTTTGDSIRIYDAITAAAGTAG